jgi:hypothetical protein
MRSIRMAEGSKGFCVALALSLFVSPLASAQTPAAPPKAAIVQPALDGVFDAFKTHPIVAMNDFHGLAQQQDVYASLVRDPRFAREVGNVVVEFGTAQHQAIIDRYVAGEGVPYLELRKVWSDAVGWNPTVTFIGFANFFASVRAVNNTLPKEQRIRVWLGDPPVDWATADRAKVRDIQATRESYPANLIAENILAKHKKSLVIYGGAHLRSEIVAHPRTAPAPGAETVLRNLLAGIARGAPDYAMLEPALAERVKPNIAYPQAELTARGAITGMKFRTGDDKGRDTFDVAFAKGSSMAWVISRNAQGLVDSLSIEPPPVLRDAVERRYPGSFFLLAPYTGFDQAACEQPFEQAHKSWPVPAFVSAVRGSALEAEMRSADCKAIRVDEIADSFLYLGPAERLTRSPLLPDLYLDAAYRAEISRRQPLIGTQPLAPNPAMETYTAAPTPWRAPTTAAPK